jgi:hypothetical protein
MFFSLYTFLSVFTWALSPEPRSAGDRTAFDWTIRLKRTSAYISYYLVLAKVLECDFWTADKRLFNVL